MKKVCQSVSFFMIITLVFFSSQACSENTNQIAEQEEHFEAEGLLLYDQDGNKLLDYFQAVSDDTLFVPHNSVTSLLQIKFYNSEKTEISAPYGDEDHSFGWIIDDESILELIRLSGDEWKIQLRGLNAGNTKIEFQVLHMGHADFRTIKIPVVVQ